MSVKTKFLSLAALLAGFAVAGPALAADKTLVSWVCLANTPQQGGSALTIQSGDRFDGIVFGERAVGKWMAGSEMYARTQADQQANPVEKADSKTLVQMAVAYQGDRITIYRNGEPCASYEANNIDLIGAKDTIAVFGLRHQGTGSGNNLKGSIDDARIYDRALTADEIRQLEPNKESSIKPYAWWTFEKGMETDRMGRFPVNNLDGGAKLEGGRLLLTQNGELIAAAKKLADMVETPAMPANPPKTWLTYHLAHPGPGNAMPGDPNCAFYWKGRYHLHYIYEADGGPAFAHVSSTDMVHWKWHPTTLTPKTAGHGMFSGTGFMTKDGKPAIIYHGQGSGRNQIAVAEDDQLEKWSKPWKLEPRIQPGQDASKIAHWDPDAWLDGDTYYALSGGTPGSGKPPTLFKSTDLKNWDYLGLFLARDMPDVQTSEDVSCPNFFKIGNKHMLLCISHNLGCRYYLGDFKDEKFVPDFHARMNWTRWDFFAPESLVTKDGRRVMWAWCTPLVNGMQKTNRSKNFNSLLNKAVFQQGIQSLPRELSLPEDGVLRIKPLRELATLRYDPKTEKKITVKSDSVYKLQDINGDSIELEVVIPASKAREFGINLLCDEKGGNGFPISYGAGKKTLTVDYVNPPFELREGEDLTLRIFIDKSMIEVFANDRQAVVAWHEYDPANLGVSLFSTGGDLFVKKVTAWKMKSAYEGDCRFKP